MSLEERKIREELEQEVENDLEKEMKDGMYRLAMKLHNLYLHRRERSESRIMGRSIDQQKKQRKSSKNIVSEVNINIKMEGGTKIEIKESKKEDRHNPNPNPNPKPNPNPNPNPKKAYYGRRVKFDWTQSLRSGSENLSVDSKIEGKKLDKLYNNTSVTRKTALLEMGWKF